MSTNDWWSDGGVETGTIRHLLDAVEALLFARNATSQGLVADVCDNCINETLSQIVQLAGGRPVPPESEPNWVCALSADGPADKEGDGGDA